MATFAPDRDTEQKLEDLNRWVRQAWDAYAQSTRDLDGNDYDQAEPESWEALQEELRQLEQERSEIVSSQRQSRRADDEPLDDH